MQSTPDLDALAESMLSGPGKKRNRLLKYPIIPVQLHNNSLKILYAKQKAISRREKSNKSCCREA